MIKRLLNLNILILSGSLIFLAVCNSAQAAIDWSYCDANGHVSIQNINLKGGQYATGQELHRVTVPISYTCYTKWKSYGPSYYTTLNLYNLAEVVTAIKKVVLEWISLFRKGEGRP